MAVEPKFPISNEQRAQRKAAANQTLEDVAEEILNGILCTYEPPNRSDLLNRKRPSGILRRPTDRPTHNKNKRNSKSSKSTRVRWIDEQTKEDELKQRQQQTLNSMVSPSVAGACMDAGIEVGLVSAPTTSSSHQMDDTTKKQMMNATEAIAIARAKSPRNARSNAADVVFDDDGNPTFQDDGTTTTKKAKPQMISLPPVPPPPNKKERFFPELCGVRINCGDDEAYVQVMPKYNFENSVNQVMDRCGNHMNDDDDDELIMMMDELDNSILGEDLDESESFGSDVETLRNSINQVRNRNREQLEANGSSSNNNHSSSRSKKSSKSSGTEKVSKKKSTREIVDHYMVKEESDEDEDGTDWEEKMSPTGSSANFLRRVWPGRPGGTKDTALATTTTEDHNSDEDGRRTKSRSRSPSLFRRGEPTMPKPMIVHDVYESVEMVKNDEKRTMKAGIGAVFKSIGAKSTAKKNVTSTTSISISETATSDWDESIPIVHDLPQSDAAPVANPSGPIPTVLPNNRVGYNVQSPSNPNHVTSLPQPVPLTQPTAASSDPTYPKLHPAHPLVNNGMKPDQDDMMERQSFITAHRLGLDPANVPKSGQMTVNDDMLERQSFIGAYRQGLEEVANPQPPVTTASGTTPATTTIGNQTISRSTNVAMPFYPQPALMTRDDMMERQSFITAYRQGYDPMQRPASAPLSHDDIMERMSYINASRQGFDQHQNVGGIPSPPKQSRREQRNRRSKSPRRNNQGIEHQNSFQPNPIHHGVLYDHMGNPVYGHPAAFYNPTMMPIQRDPPVSGSNDLYPVMGDPNSAQQYYAVQNYSQPMYMNSNTPPRNDAMPPGVPYPYYDNQTSVQNAGISNDRSLSTVQLTSIDENTPTPAIEESAVEPELTWEERTRQAWERIRGGISALTFETSNDEKVNDDEVKAEDESGQIEQSLSLSDAANQANTTNGVPLPHSAATLYASHTLAQPHEMVKRVSFGEPQQLIYYDDQDENRSTMSLPGKSSKKKKQFRGSKLVSGVFGKVKNSFHKVALSRSMSSDTLGSFTSGRSSHSQDLDGSVIHQVSSMPILPYSHQVRPLQQNYLYPSNYGSPVLMQNAPPQHAPYNADPRLLPNVSQHPYPNQMNQPNQNQMSYQPQQQPQYPNNPVTYPVPSNASMYHAASSQYQPQQQQQHQQPYSMYRNDRRSL